MPNGSLRKRLAQALRDLSGSRKPDRSALAAVSVRVEDARGWDTLTSGPADRSWAERLDDLTDVLEAWQKNFLVRRIVTLTRSYVIGDGITLSSSDPQVDAFIEAFWHHPKNHMPARLGAMCDELTRAGELFPVLFTNRADGMSYIRFVPATQITEIETDPEDYESEIAYHQVTSSGAPRVWVGLNHPSAFRRPRGSNQYGAALPPLMLHFAVNRPIGASRGEGDLTPALPWARRYSEWLKDRVRLNRIRTRQGLMDVQLSDDTLIDEKRRQLTQDNPVEAGIYVHGPGERVTLHALEIGADEASEDGKTLRLAVAAGANVGLHYLGEGSDVNYATAKEMGEPTARFYTERQAELIAFLKELVTAAYARYEIVRAGPADRRRSDARLPWPPLPLQATAAEPARADNESLGRATQMIVEALARMREQGWIDDPTAVRLAFKFAGEPLTQDEIARILAAASAPGAPLAADDGSAN